MPDCDRNSERAIRGRAYLIWEREGHPEGQVDDHWQHAKIEVFGAGRVADGEPIDDEERIIAGRSDANIPASLTKDVRAG
jgi:hypothetical protein